MIGAADLFSICFLLFTLPRWQALEESLFFTTEGVNQDSLSMSSGFYGGFIDPRKDGSAQNLFSTGINCINVAAGSSNLPEVNFQSISFDPISKHVLLQIDSELTLFESNICRPTPTCENKTESITPLFVNVRINGFTIGAVAYYDSNVYAVVQKKGETGAELRKLEGCEERYPITNIKPFSLDDCSSTIATLVLEPDEHTTYEATGHLLIHKTRDGLQFFTQLKRLVFLDAQRLESVSMELFVIMENKEARSLHLSEVPQSYNQYRLPHVGGLSMRDDIICWSTMQQLFCGRMDGSSLTDIVTVLDMGDTANVCNDIPTDPELINLSTGVAIAKTHPDIILYFGCVASGGAGLARVPSGGGKTELFPITSNGTQISAGSMFLTRECFAIGGSEKLTSTWCLFFLLVIFISDSINLFMS